MHLTTPCAGLLLPSSCLKIWLVGSLLFQTR